MAWYLEAGWNVAEIGSLSVDLDDGTTQATVTISTGKFCHTDLTSVLGTSQYDDFAGKLKTEIDNSAISPTVLVTWDQAAGAYTLSFTFGSSVSLTFSGDSGTRMRRVLGFSGNQSTANSHTSNVTPYYYIEADQGGISEVTDEYEDSDVAEEAEAGDGSSYGVAWPSVSVYSDWTVPMESHAKVMEWKAPDGTTAGDVPWTWQHFYKHCRNVEPFLASDGTNDTVHYLRAKAARFQPERRQADWDELWDIRLETRLEGRL